MANKLSTDYRRGFEELILLDSSARKENYLFEGEWGTVSRLLCKTVLIKYNHSVMLLIHCRDIEGLTADLNITSKRVRDRVMDGTLVCSEIGSYIIPRNTFQIVGHLPNSTEV